MAQTETDGLEVLETREWVDSLDYVLSSGGPNRAGRLLQQLALHARREAGINLPFSATTPYQNTIPARQQAPFPGSQEMERRIKSLVRWNALAMVVRANKIQEGHRRTHFDVRFCRHALRSCLQPFLSRANRKRRPRRGLLPGTRRPGNLFPRLSRRPHFEREAAEFPPRAEAGRRTEFLSPSVAHAGVLGVPHGFDGTRADPGDLSRALHQVSGESRTQAVHWRQGLGVSGRWRNGRTRVAGIDHAGFARETRQSHLRGELQPAAARRAGARQWKNHSGTGSDFPRRRLERHQSHLGHRLGQL